MLDNLDIAEALAKKMLPKGIYDHIAGGAGEEITLNANREAYSRINFLPRVLNDVSNVDMQTNLLGLNVSNPIIVAPMSYHGLVNEEKEFATARACAQSGSLMIVSMMSNVALEPLAKVREGKFWLQIHLHKNRSITEQLIKRAEKAQYKAIVITVDIPLKGNRKRDLQNKFSFPANCIPANFTNEHNQVNDEALTFNPCATWEDIRWIKTVTHLPIILKGIMHPADALLAIKYKVGGIIVSNHGGRQLDSALACIEALPEIVKVIANKIPILIDGGIRNGNDIAKAIALGTQAVLIGRPILWGLAVGGETGVIEIINCLKKELGNTMRLLGYSSLTALRVEGNTVVVLPKTHDVTIELLIKQLNELSLEVSQLKNIIRNNSDKGSPYNTGLFPKL